MSKKNSSTYLAELMMDVMPKAMQSIREEMRSGRGDKLTVPQFRLLAAVNRGLSHNKEIGELLGVSEAAISRMVDVLTQEALIKKGISKRDRRQSVLSLTPEGQKLFLFIKSEARNRMKQKLDSLSEKDMNAVILGLEILQQNIAVFSA